MPRLLVSVRSAEEARRAIAGGASIIDVKEPANGPLGRASFQTWRDVRRAVPDDMPVSVALGELSEWTDDLRGRAPLGAFEGLAFRKLGLAGAGADWKAEWLALRASLPSPSCGWIAVIYTDWRAAAAPEPEAVLNSGFPFDGVLFDTWDKSRPAVWTPDLIATAGSVRERGKTLAVAGGLTPTTLDQLAALRPDVVAVRGAACIDGDRTREVDAEHVAVLVQMLGRIIRRRTGRLAPGGVPRRS